MTLGEIRALPNGSYIRDKSPGYGCWVVFKKKKYSLTYTNIIAKYIGHWETKTEEFVYTPNGLESDIDMDLPWMRSCTEAEAAEIALQVY